MESASFLEKAILLKCSLALGEALFSGIKRKEKLGL